MRAALRFVSTGVLTLALGGAARAGTLSTPPLSVGDTSTQLTCWIANTSDRPIRIKQADIVDGGGERVSDNPLAEYELARGVIGIRALPPVIGYCHVVAAGSTKALRVTLCKSQIVGSYANCLDSVAGY